MNRKISNGLEKRPIAILALLILSACTSAMELEDGDYSGGDETVASTDEDEAAPADAVPGDDISPEGRAIASASPEEGAAPTDSNPELELAAAAAAGQPASGTENIASTDSASAPAAPIADAGSAGAPASDLPPIDMATDSGPPAPVAATDLPPPVVDSQAAVQSQGSAPLAQENSSPVAAAPTEAPSEVPSGDAISYTVQKGDTLMKISWDQYGDLFRWREIYSLNKSKIADPNHVPPGTVLQIAGQGRSPASAMEHTGEQYLIIPGDTLGRISGKVYGSKDKWKKIWENNKRLIRDPNKIYAGFYLYYVPEAKMTLGDEESEPAGARDS